MQFKLHQINDRIFTAIMLAIIATIITYSGVLTRFDYLHYDLGRYFTFKPAPADIVIVAIDEASLASLGRWPWSRTVHADLIDKLKQAQAKVIGIDIIFSEHELNSTADAALDLALIRANNVVLPILFEEPYAGSALKQSVPIKDFSEHAAALGRVHVPLDSDGIARGIYLWEGLGEKYLQPHFSQAVLLIAKALPRNIKLTAPKLQATNVSHLISLNLTSLEARKVKFLGPPGHFQRISYVSVLTGESPQHFFKDKIVLVGATAVGLGDVLPTPVSAHLQPMPGVEFHANVIAGMRNAELITDAPFWLTCLLGIIFAVIPVLFLPKFSALKSLLVMVAYYLTVTLAAVAAPQFFNIWIPPAGALIAIVLAYPIWSWRKLESAQVYLDHALQSLQADLALMGVSRVDFKHTKIDEDLMHSRIANVNLASLQLQSLHGEWRDTLSFISHDLRAPLGTAIMMLNDDTAVKNLPRITQLLKKSLEMSDNFLQTSRAEMTDVAKFQALDLVGALQQAVDDVYDAARIKAIKLNTKVADKSFWLMGDFGLLQRVISNILLNAIKYSPEKAEVNINLTKKNNEAILSITDHGSGISADKINKLFKRYSRAEGEHQAADGIGLGLYFVAVSVRKHQGKVSVESVLGQGATFTIVLPLENAAL